MVPMMYVDGRLNIMLKGTLHQVVPEHPAYNLVIKALNDDVKEDELYNMLYNTQKAVEKYVDISNANIVIKDINGEIYVELNGTTLHNTITQRIAECMRVGLPYKHLGKFLDNLYQNPSMNSVEQLYGFMEHVGMPITEDGYLLAYKGVKDNYYDVYSGKISNRVGARPKMPRNQVCDDPNSPCGRGLHAGSYDYAVGWGARVVCVKIHPKDVVSVPRDSSCRKLRCCEYSVVRDCTGLMDESPVYTANAAPIRSEKKVDLSFTKGMNKLQTQPQRDCKGRFVKGGTVNQKRDSRGRFI